MVDACSDSHARASSLYFHVYKIGPFLSQSVTNGTPYEDIQLSPVMQELINSGVSTKTPSEIYREIRDIPEGKLVTRHQVYYLWQKANAKLWQRDSDPLVSAQILLSESSDYQGHHRIFT